MTSSTTDISTQLKDEILYPFAKRYQTYGLIAILALFLNFFIVGPVIRYVQGTDIGNPTLWAVLGILFLTIVEMAVLGTSIRVMISRTCLEITRRYPRGTSDFRVAMEVINSIDTQTIRRLRKALARREELYDGLLPETQRPDSPATADRDKGKADAPEFESRTREENLIDLNEGQN